MKRNSFPTTSVMILLLGSFLFGAVGCNLEVAGDIAALSGAYLGDVVTVVVTGCLHDALGIEDGGSHDEHADDDGHSHDAEPLHDHEH